MKAIPFALVVLGILMVTSYRARTFEPESPVAPGYIGYDGYGVTAPDGLQRSMDRDSEPWL